MSNYLSYLRIPVLASSSIAALGSSLLYFRQNDIIYPASLPAGSRTAVPTPEDYKLQNSESIFFLTPDGEKLHAYYLRPPTSPQSLRKNITVLTFHGNAGNVGHRLPIGKVLSETLGCHVFMLEYRGYGLSTGSPDEKGLTIDSQTALDYIRQHDEMKHTHIVVYGQSIGGAVAVKLVGANQKRKRLAATKKNDDGGAHGSGSGEIAGLILENTFTSIRKLIPSVMPPARFLIWLCHQQWSSDETIQKYAEDGPPILFLSGRQDEIVPPAMMTTLFDLCKTKQKVWKEFPAGDHNSTVAEPEYFDAIWSFLVQEVIPRASERRKLTVGTTDVDPEELWT